MIELTRQVLFQNAAKQLRQEFETLYPLPHQGLKGQEAERLLRDFLDDHLPRRFATGSGFILDRSNARSRQTDVLIYDALNCPVYRTSDTAAIFPNDNVAAVVEVKSTLSAPELDDAADKIAVAKSLRKSRGPDMPFLVNTRTLGCLFAFQSSVSLEAVAERYERRFRGTSYLGQHLDVIAVLDQGLVTLVAQPPGMGWSTALVEGPGGREMEGMHIGVGWQPLGTDTLDAFFRVLLMYLSCFRGIVDHPGFDFSGSESGGQVHISYLTSVTYERDAAKREERLRQYREEVMADFRKQAPS